jgi:putative radical SAM enzyme (TIGR03279 family)
MLKKGKRAKGHIVSIVLPGSIAEELGIEPGDKVLSISGEEIGDVFDYQYFVQNEYLTLLVEKQNGEEWEFDIEKEETQDLGLEFESSLMDEYRSCQNKCIFCFIDQMPPGMRKTLYFKDDDSRLSFLQGNYVTLTNLSRHDIDRIIKFHLSPINISIHTMNPTLRCKMLHNRFAGEALKVIDRLWEAGTWMNGQIVLCKGINDGKELEYTIEKLSRYLPYLQSVSVVPVGLTRYREDLYPLEPFLKEDAKEVLSLIHRWQEKLYKEQGSHFIHGGDEWYLLAGEPFPQEDNYDGYLQLENGVGMMRLFLDEFQEALRIQKEENGAESTDGSEEMDRKGAIADESEVTIGKRSIAAEREGMNRRRSIATGSLAYPYLQQMANQIMEAFPDIEISVYPIENHFFGEQITVSGLLTGQDILKDLTGKDLGEKLLLPQNMLRQGEDYFLDDMRVADLEKALQVPIDIVKSSGTEFLTACLR